MEIPGQPGKKNLQDPISIEKSWVWWHAAVIPVTLGNLK
jgi:hypothetical protein